VTVDRFGLVIGLLSSWTQLVTTRYRSVLHTHSSVFSHGVHSNRQATVSYRIFPVPHRSNSTNWQSNQLSIATRKSKSKLLYDWRSVSQYVLVSAPLWGPWPDFTFSFLLPENCLVLGRPLWREDGSVICSAICQWSDSRRTKSSYITTDGQSARMCFLSYSLGTDHTENTGSNNPSTFVSRGLH
jgi:hypothetical protein